MNLCAVQRGSERARHVNQPGQNTYTKMKWSAVSGVSSMLARWGRWRSWWEGTSWAERRPGDAGERWRGEGRDSRGGEGSEGGYRPWRRARTRLRVPCTQRSSKNRSRPSSPRPAVPRCPIWCPVHPPRPRSPIARPVRESPCAPPQRCAVTPRTLPVPVATRCPRRIHPPRTPPAHSGDLRACGRRASPAAPRANSSRRPVLAKATGVPIWPPLRRIRERSSPTPDRTLVLPGHARPEGSHRAGRLPERACSRAVCGHDGKSAGHYTRDRNNMRIR